MMPQVNSLPLSPSASSQPYPVALDNRGLTTIGTRWPAFRKVNTDASTPALTAPDTTMAEMAHWDWPDKPIIFVSDPHADADAFVASLVASGSVVTGKKKTLKLTKLGRNATFVIGGDCLDKGPSNLTMLRKLKALFDTGAKVKLIAGNHDLRLLMGLSAISRQRHTSYEHMFVRMGSKVIPLFQEVFREYLAGTKWQQKTPSEAECRAELFPRQAWFHEFPEFAAQHLPADAIERELNKLGNKVDSFEQHCLNAGMSLQMVYAAARKCHKLFIKPSGEFSWFYRNMQLAYRKGSFLFVHAGLDDEISADIRQHGIKKLNRRFKQTLKKDLFAFYFSSLASTFRTKYRKSDPDFTPQGAEAIKDSGIRAVVHGHVSHGDGQQISLQEGLLHVEGDITLDRNSRQKEGLDGIGFGATIIHPKQMIVGISADYPFAKVLSPQQSPWQILQGPQYAS